MATYSSGEKVEILEYLILGNQLGSADQTIEYDLNLTIEENQIVEVFHFAVVANDHSDGTAAQIEGWSLGKNDNFDNSGADGGNRFGAVQPLFHLDGAVGGTGITVKHPNDGAGFPNPYSIGTVIETYTTTSNADIALTKFGSGGATFVQGMDMYVRYRRVDGDDAGDNFRLNLMLKRTTFQ